MEDFLLPHKNTIIIGVFVAILIVSYSILKRSAAGAAKSKTTPEAAGGWPLIGHLHLLLGGSDQLPHITLGALAEKHGPAFTFRIGMVPALVISSWELAKECFTINDIPVSFRPKLVSTEHFTYNYAMFGFSPYGPYWREIRKIVSLELLSNHRLEKLKHVRGSETEFFLKDLYKSSSKDGSALVDMKKLFGDLGLNVIVRMVAGKRYFGTGAVMGEKERERFQKAIRGFFYYLGLFVVGDAIPFLRWFDFGGHEKAMKETAKELDCIVTEWLEEHKHKRASGEAKGDQDFMDVMLRILDGDNFAGFDVDAVIKSTSINLIAGGSDTTPVTLTWALSLLLNNPHSLKKAQEELDKHVGKGRLVNEGDISNLTYLQAIVKETLRLHPATPLLAPREFSEDCTVGGYHVPKGTRLVVNVWKIQTDPSVWSESLKFKPERFLTTHKDIEVRGQNFELIPFGAGRRACPGISLGLHVTHLALASLLHAFEISNPSNAPIDMTESFGLTNIKSTPLDVLVKPRLPLNHYE